MVKASGGGNVVMGSIYNIWVFTTKDRHTDEVKVVESAYMRYDACRTYNKLAKQGLEPKVWVGRPGKGEYKRTTPAKLEDENNKIVKLSDLLDQARSAYQGEWLFGVPEEWTWFWCENLHRSTSYLKSEQLRHNVCFACHGTLWSGPERFE